MVEHIPTTDDSADADMLIVNSPDVTPGEVERAKKGQGAGEAETPQKAVSAEPEPVDEHLANLGSKAIQDMLDGFGVQSSPTINELSGTFVSDLAAVFGMGGSRIGRMVAIGGMLTLVCLPPALKFFGVIGVKNPPGTEEAGI